ncbi:hypothetical protein ISU75_17525 [Leptospira borgpetersenii serovar Hardjo-bovis]|nr:hypothetical protein [Leptospira borgpetersenii serovar Hardjo-bovis]
MDRDVGVAPLPGMRGGGCVGESCSAEKRAIRDLFHDRSGSAAALVYGRRKFDLGKISGV